MKLTVNTSNPDLKKAVENLNNESNNLSEESINEITFAEKKRKSIMTLCQEKQKKNNKNKNPEEQKKINDQISKDRANANKMLTEVINKHLNSNTKTHDNNGSSPANESYPKDINRSVSSKSEKELPVKLHYKLLCLSMFAFLASAALLTILYGTTMLGMAPLVHNIALAAAITLATVGTLNLYNAIEVKTTKNDKPVNLSCCTMFGQRKESALDQEQKQERPNTVAKL